MDWRPVHGAFPAFCLMATGDTLEYQMTPVGPKQGKKMNDQSILQKMERLKIQDAKTRLLWEI